MGRGCGALLDSMRGIVVFHAGYGCIPCGVWLYSMRGVVVFHLGHRWIPCVGMVGFCVGHTVDAGC